MTDGSSLENLQIVVEDIETDSGGKDATVRELANSLNSGAGVEFEGVLALHGGKPCNAGEVQKFELLATHCSLLGQCAEDYPIQKKNQTLEFLRRPNLLHLRARTNTFGAVSRIRNAATMGIHDFFQKEGFIQVHTPVITSNDCEGAGELFAVKVETFRKLVIKM